MDAQQFRAVLVEKRLLEADTKVDDGRRYGFGQV